MEAFVALARYLGFDARPRLGEMTAPGERDHGAAVVVLDGRIYSVDQNLLWPHPLPLDVERVTSVEGPHYTAEARYDGQRRVFRIRRFNASTEFPPTVLLDREVTRADYLPAWEHSLTASYFNQGYFVNRLPAGVWRQLDTTRYQELASAEQPLREEAPPDNLPRFIEERFGIRARLVKRLLELERRAG
jgi:hypothetical protein